jgi:hypothetical protein
LGRVDAKAGNIAEAIAETALGLSSGHDSSTYFQISRLYRLEGKTVEAQQAVNHAKALITQRRDRAVIALQGTFVTHN